MIVVRSWPKDVPAFRAQVDDEYRRIFIDDFDHSSLVGYDDDVLLLEWDMAVSPEDVLRFTDFCMNDRTRVAAAPYRLYPVSTGLPGAVWAHRIVIASTPFMARWGIGERFADLVGLGMTYLPKELIRAYVADIEWMPQDRRLTDTNFGLWHYHKYGRKIPIDWRIHPVHLHYC